MADTNFAYHNHTPEFRAENEVIFYDELLQGQDPAKVAMELIAAGRQSPGKTRDSANALPRSHQNAARERFQAHTGNHAGECSAFDGTRPRHDRSSPHLRSRQESGHQTPIRRAGEFDMPPMEALKTMPINPPH